MELQQQQGFIDPSGKYTLKNPGPFAVVQVLVWKEEGETSFKANKGCMLAMTGNLDFRTQGEGSLGGGILRSALTGASRSFMHFFVKPSLPPGTIGDVILAPTAPGDIIMLEAHAAGPEGWILAKDVFLACDGGVTINLHAQKSLVKGMFSGQGLFLLKAQGFGRLLVSSYGSIMRHDLQPGESRKVDNGCLVAWTASMDYIVGKSSRSLKAAVMSGEGLSTKFTGPGVVYVQTRSIEDLQEACPIVTSTSSSDGGAGVVGDILGAVFQ